VRVLKDYTDPLGRASEADYIELRSVAQLDNTREWSARRWPLEFISISGILCLRRQEATAMGSLRFADLQTRPTEVLDLTSLTLAELQRLVPPFAAAFQAHMAHWRLYKVAIVRGVGLRRKVCTSGYRTVPRSRAQPQRSVSRGAYQVGGKGRLVFLG
jgi:hypothetical protein